MFGLHRDMHTGLEVAVWGKLYFVLDLPNFGALRGWIYRVPRTVSWSSDFCELRLFK